MVERRLVFSFVVFLVVVALLNILSASLFGFFLSPSALTGKAVEDIGIVEIFVSGPISNVTIHAPENITYYFDKGVPYLLDLNVSANFDVEPGNESWKYSLYDDRHSVLVEHDTYFDPNSTFNAVRWQNMLTVSALGTDGNWFGSNVFFFIEVPNSAPIIGDMNDTISVCEGEQMSYAFNVTDVDEDELVSDISPKDIFYLSEGIQDWNITYYAIISGLLELADVGDNY